jgi:hypothetical protein
MNFSATPSPNGITFLGTNGRTYTVPNADANFAAVRTKMLAVQQARDPAAAKAAWDEMTNLVGGKTSAPAAVVEVPKAAKKAPAKKAIKKAVPVKQMDQTKFLIAMRELETGGGYKPNRDPGIRLVEHLLNSSLETNFAKGRLDGSQLATLRSAYERARSWDIGSDLLAAPVEKASDGISHGTGVPPGQIAMIEYVDVVSNRWGDLDETRGMTMDEAFTFIRCQAHPASYRIKGDDKRLQAVIDVRLGGGKHVFGTVFGPVTVLVNGVERVQFTGTGLSGHRQAFDYCQKTFGFTDGDINYLCANANFLRPVEEVKLREVLGKVNIIVNGVGQRSFSEYRAAAEAVQERYGFTDGDMMAIYHDYREDYDNQ